ncbi:hypothetical protein GCM10010080_30960 [Thermomonas carbonis]|nr:hypothetical protein GCM10010080_30960 [Thermomonas carbonis]
MSVYVSDEPFGLVHGELDLSHLPRVGELISFTQPNSGIELLPKDHPLNPLIFTVSSVTHRAGTDLFPPLLSLNDIILRTTLSAQQLLDYLESGFGLFAERWDKT